MTEPANQIDASSEEVQVQDQVSTQVFSLREQGRNFANLIMGLKNTIKDSEVGSAKEDQGEMIANAMLAYRHVEDAVMRLGKVMQAKDGGQSIYPR